MDLFALRHAQASPDAPSDAERPLTPTGRRHAEALALRLRTLGALPAKIFSSPLVRARETALALDPNPELTDILAPGASPREICDFLAPRVTRDDRVFVVGHQPDLGALISALTGHGSIVLPPCGLARISIDRPDVAWTGHLVWLLTPDVFDA